MKSRILNLFASSILGLSLFFTPASVLAVSVTRDQYCVTTGNYDTISGATTVRTQTFKPKQNRLERVNLIVAGVNMTGSSTVRMKILKGTAVLGTADTMPNLDEDVPDYRTWEFSPAITLTPEATYTVQVDVLDGAMGMLRWYYSNSECYTRGIGTSEPPVELVGDFNFETYGYTYAAPSTNTDTDTSTDSTTTTPTTTAKATTTTDAPVVSPDKLAIPMNFRLDRDLEAEKIFAWDLNKEKDLAGYVLYVYEATKETELEIIDIPDKALDNYNLDLAGHPLLKAGGEYDVKIAAKNKAGAVSEKTWSIRIKYPEPTVVVAEATFTEKYLTNPYVLGGLGLLLVALVALLVFLEKKYHGLGRLLLNKKTTKKE